MMRLPTMTLRELLLLVGLCAIVVSYCCVAGRRPSLQVATRLEFSPDGQRLAAVYRSGVVHVWDLSRPDPEPIAKTQLDVKGWSPPLRWARIGQQNTIVYAVEQAGGTHLKLWNPTTGSHSDVAQVKGQVSVDRGFVTREATLAFCLQGPNARYYVVDLASGEVADARIGGNRLLDISPDGKRYAVEMDGIAVVRAGNCVSIWDKDGSEAAEFSADGRILLVRACKGVRSRLGSEEVQYFVRAYEESRRKTRFLWEIQTEYFGAGSRGEDVDLLRLTPDGKQVVVVRWGVEVFDIATGKRIAAVRPTGSRAWSWRKWWSRAPLLKQITTIQSSSSWLRDGLSPDGRLYAETRKGRPVTVYEIATRKSWMLSEPTWPWRQATLHAIGLIVSGLLWGLFARGERRTKWTGARTIMILSGIYLILRAAAIGFLTRGLWLNGLPCIAIGLYSIAAGAQGNRRKTLRVIVLQLVGVVVCDPWICLSAVALLVLWSAQRRLKTKKRKERRGKGHALFRITSVLALLIPITGFAQGPSFKPPDPPDRFQLPLEDEDSQTAMDEEQYCISGHWGFYGYWGKRRSGGRYLRFWEDRDRVGVNSYSPPWPKQGDILPMFGCLYRVTVPARSELGGPRLEFVRVKAGEIPDRYQVKRAGTSIVPLQKDGYGCDGSYLASDARVVFQCTSIEPDPEAPDEYVAVVEATFTRVVSRDNKRVKSDKTVQFSLREGEIHRLDTGLLDPGLPEHQYHKFMVHRIVPRDEQWKTIGWVELKLAWKSTWLHRDYSRHAPKAPWLSVLLEAAQFTGDHPAREMLPKIQVREDFAWPKAVWEFLAAEKTLSFWAHGGFESRGGRPGWFFRTNSGVRILGDTEEAIRFLNDQMKKQGFEPFPSPDEEFPMAYRKRDFFWVETMLFEKPDSLVGARRRSCGSKMVWRIEATEKRRLPTYVEVVHDFPWIAPPKEALEHMPAAVLELLPEQKFDLVRAWQIRGGSYSLTVRIPRSEMNDAERAALGKHVVEILQKDGYERFTKAPNEPPGQVHYWRGGHKSGRDGNEQGIVQTTEEFVRIVLHVKL